MTEPNGHDESQSAEAVTMPSCGNCVHYVANKDPKEGICRANPPVPLVAGYVEMLAGQAPRPRILGYFAPTAANILCGRHPFFMNYVRIMQQRAQEAEAAKVSGLADLGQTETAGEA